jgi:putative membrane protein
LILNHDLSDKKSKIGLILIFLFGLIVEILGVNYGLFFGEYSYGANLGPKIYEVPYVIGFNWVLLIIATGSVSDKLIKGKEIYKILFASFLMVLIDLLSKKVHQNLTYGNS